ncbi:UNVERIFIED_CONTAM: hypothetical protein Sindi_1823900 [Sesamum indicum]
MKMIYWCDCDDEPMFCLPHVSRKVNPEDTFRRPVYPGQVTLVGQQGQALAPDLLGQRALPAGVLKE